jgi:hypothetical protein
MTLYMCALLFCCVCTTEAEVSATVVAELTVNLAVSEAVLGDADTELVQLRDDVAVTQEVR